MEFVYELSLDDRISVPVKVCSLYEIYSGYYGKKLRVLKPLNAQLVSAIRRERIKNIEILPFWVQKQIDLRFLNELPDLEALTIHSDKAIDWVPVTNLTQLKVLRLRTSGLRPQTIDFRCFKELHTCVLTWHPEWSSILQCTRVQHLTIEHTKGISVLRLQQLPNLQELCIRECKGLRNLVFAGGQRIESLAVTATSSFQDLEPIRILNGLKYLAFGNHVKFDIELIARCRNLRKLWLNGVGKIPSLDFLKGCKHLEYLQMLYSTNVENGDLDGLMKLQKLRTVRFQNRRHYSHTVSQINRLLKGEVAK